MRNFAVDLVAIKDQRDGTVETNNPHLVIPEPALAARNLLSSASATADSWREILRFGMTKF
jgi:hypothetical protein